MPQSYSGLILKEKQRIVKKVAWGTLMLVAT